MDGGPGAEADAHPGRSSKCRVTEAGMGLGAGAGKTGRTRRAALSCRPEDAAFRKITDRDADEP